MIKRREVEVPINGEYGMTAKRNCLGNLSLMWPANGSKPYLSFSPEYQSKVLFVLNPNNALKLANFINKHWAYDAVIGRSATDSYYYRLSRSVIDNWTIMHIQDSGREDLVCRTPREDMAKMLVAVLNGRG